MMDKANSSERMGSSSEENTAEIANAKNVKSHKKMTFQTFEKAVFKKNGKGKSNSTQNWRKIMIKTSWSQAAKYYSVEMFWNTG